MRFLLGLRVLPTHVARFYWRAERAARQAEDRWSLDSAVRPKELAALIELARGRERVVELGTGTAWTAIALTLSDPQRKVVTYDPVVRPERDLYLRLVGSGVRAHLELVTATSLEGARQESSVDMVFVDSSHGRAETVVEFQEWRRRLRRNGLIVFHDYGHPQYPGVAQGIEDLGLQGEVRGSLFVWTCSGA